MNIILNFLAAFGPSGYGALILSLQFGIQPDTIKRMEARLKRVALGNYGDVKPVGQGVSELRLKFGSGYRVYFSQHGEEIIVLLCGGDKGSQTDDIETAKSYWADFKRRNNA